jgi:hypothetical protein
MNRHVRDMDKYFLEHLDYRITSGCSDTENENETKTTEFGIAREFGISQQLIRMTNTLIRATISLYVGIMQAFLTVYMLEYPTFLE